MNVYTAEDFRREEHLLSDDPEASEEREIIHVREVLK